jgi:hypothetical protein
VGSTSQELTVRFKAAAGIRFDTNNIFKLEVSTLTGDFEDPRFPPRIIGSFKSNVTAGELVNFRLPENLITYGPALPVGTPYRYRVRLTSSHPYYESFNTGEIASIQNCPDAQPDLALSTVRPYKRIYYRGNQVAVTVYRNPNPAFPLGETDRIRLQWSSPEGFFADNIGLPIPTTTILDSVAPNFTGDSLVINFVIPRNFPNSTRYRLRATATSEPLGFFSAGNGHDVVIQDSVGIPIAVAKRSVGKLNAWPVPATNTISWSVAPEAGQVIRATLTSLTGQSTPISSLPKEGNLANLAPGIYILQLETAKGLYTARIIKE